QPGLNIRVLANCLNEGLEPVPELFDSSKDHVGPVRRQAGGVGFWIALECPVCFVLIAEDELPGRDATELAVGGREARKLDVRLTDSVAKTKRLLSKRHRALGPNRALSARLRDQPSAGDRTVVLKRPPSLRDVVRVPDAQDTDDDMDGAVSERRFPVE